MVFLWSWVVFDWAVKAQKMMGPCIPPEVRAQPIDYSSIYSKTIKSTGLGLQRDRLRLANLSPVCGGELTPAVEMQAPVDRHGWPGDVAKRDLGALVWLDQHLWLLFIPGGRGGRGARVGS